MTLGLVGNKMKHAWFYRSARSFVLVVEGCYANADGG